MEVRKNLVDCINSLIDNWRQVLNRYGDIKAHTSGLHKETTGSRKSYDLKLYWKGTDSDLLELVTALYASGVIESNRPKLERKELMSAFENLFNLRIKNREVKLHKVRERKKDPAAFLERLKQTFTKNSESISLRRS